MRLWGGGGGLVFGVLGWVGCGWWSSGLGARGGGFVVVQVGRWWGRRWSFGGWRVVKLVRFGLVIGCVWLRWWGEW